MGKPSHERVLEAVAGGERTWDELLILAKLNAEQLGLVLNGLFDARKIWTAERGGVRVYGMERRRGLAPRFPHMLRRTTDRVWGA